MRRVRVGRPRTADGWIGVGFALSACIEAVVRFRNPAYLAINIAGAPFLLFLAIRRARPLLTLSIFCAGAMIGSGLQAWLVPRLSSDAFVPILAVMLAVYSVAAHGSRRQVAVAAPLPLLVVVVIDASRPHTDSLLSAVVFFSIFLIALPIVAGRLVRHRSLLVAQLEAQAAELAEQRSAHVSAALTRERVRLASELDVELADGMQSLLAMLERGGSVGEAEVAAVETQARDLLGSTREVVTTLTNAEFLEDVPPGRSAALDDSDRRAGDVAQPWMCLLAACVCAGLLIEVRSATLYVPELLASVAIVGLATPLLLLWARPLPATVASWAAAVVITHQVTPLQHLTTPIALNFIPPFAVAALEPRRRAAIGLACCWLGILLVDGPGAFPGNAVIATVCWAAGAGLRARTGLIEQLRRNNLLLAEGRAALTARAVEEERSRLARELHDAVGHSLTVVALQAAAALRIWPTDRSRAEEMLATTRAAVVDGLRELQTSLAASSDGQGSVDQLIVQARAAGVQVTAQVDDEVAVLPPRYRQAIYRTVQEALTNAVKHSPGSAVDISVRHVDDGVTLQVYNGPAAAPRAPSPHSGHGLIGMRRRLEQLGGSLSHEQRPDGGFRLRAQLPCRSGST